MIKHPYDMINKENFDKIKQLLMDGAEKSLTPFTIAQNISKETGINIQYCIALVHEELMGSMNK